VARKTKKNGRSEGDPRFIQVPYWVLETPATRALSGTAFKLLVYIVKRFNGVNNGIIGFGVRSGCYVRKPGTGELIDLPIGIQPRTTANGLRELQEAGLIACTKASSFGQKKLQREWRVTWLGTPDGKMATKEFATIQPGTKKQKPVHQGALSPKLQCTPVHNRPARVPKIPPYSALQCTMAHPVSAPGCTHIVTIPGDSEPVPIFGCLTDLIDAVRVESEGWPEVLQ
jgi:hypothetical protein